MVKCDSAVYQDVTPYSFGCFMSQQLFKWRHTHIRTHIKVRLRFNIIFIFWCMLNCMCQIQEQLYPYTPTTIYPYIRIESGLFNDHKFVVSAYNLCVYYWLPHIILPFIYCIFTRKVLYYIVQYIYTHMWVWIMSDQNHNRHRTHHQCGNACVRFAFCGWSFMGGLSTCGEKYALCSVYHCICI